MKLQRPFIATILLTTAVAAGCATPAAESPGAVQASPSPTASQPLAPTTEVPLSNATGNDITIEIDDESGSLVGATSGSPGGGASVEPYAVAIVNDDATTLRLTWVGGACDAHDLLAIDASARRFVLVQPECPGDAVAFDRVLVLRFAQPVEAGDIEAILQDGVDTAG